MMRRPRVSIRWLMAAVLAIGLGLGLGVPAAEVDRAREIHAHGSIARGADSRWAISEDHVPSPFWPRYRLRLLGRPWKAQPVCEKRPGRVDEVCSVEEPEEFLSTCFSPSLRFRPTIDMRRKERSLNGLEPDPRLEALALSIR